MADHIRNPDPQFPDRPQHADFWQLSEAVSAHDERVETADDKAEAFAAVVADYIDRDSLVYMARNRAARVTNDVAAVGTFIDGFVLGCAFERARHATCRYCGTTITRDYAGVWIDATGGDGCGDAPGEQPYSHGSHSPIVPVRLRDDVQPYTTETSLTGSSECVWCDDCAELEGAHTHEWFVLREGASQRTADELTRCFIDDVAALTTWNVPADTPEPDGWLEDDDASEMLRDVMRDAESVLGDAGLSVNWNDGYVIERIVEHT